MHSDDPPDSTDITLVVRDFTALWLAGEFRVAGEKYWAEDVVIIEPDFQAADANAVCRGIEAVRA